MRRSLALASRPPLRTLYDESWGLFKQEHPSAPGSPLELRFGGFAIVTRRTGTNLPRAFCRVTSGSPVRFNLKWVCLETYKAGGRTFPHNAEILQLCANAWWSWSDSNQQ